MRLGTRLCVIAGGFWLTAMALSAQQGQRLGLASQAPAASPLAPLQSTSAVSPAQGLDGARASSDYLGSAACARCHASQYKQWAASLHVRMTKPIAEATVLGDFRAPARFSAHGRSYEFGRRDGRPFIRVTEGDTPPETFAVDYTLGAKRYQGYLSTLPDGRIYVLPAFWHVQSGRWVDWKEITPIPDDAHGLRQIWNANCFNCHATNLVQGFDIASKTYKTTWTEMGIACEACHGPGGPHVALMEAWASDPASRPVFDRSAGNLHLGDTLRIFSPRTAARRQVFDTCGYCHGNKNNVFVGFRPGDTFEDYAMPFLVSSPIPANDIQGEFWPDGRPNRFNRPQALMLSGCFKAGAIACTNCHVAHGSINDHSLKVDIHDGRMGDLLCTQCHTGPSSAPAPVVGAVPAVAPPARLVGSRPPTGQDSSVPWTDAALERHTHHKASSAGSRCIGCHMSDVNWRLLIRRRDHTFEPPVPEVTVGFGVPNACTTCHDARTPEWAAAQMDAWWGDGARRARVRAMADTMYRAGSRDPSVIPELARLAVDRTQGAPIRASAADFIRQLATGGAAPASAQSQTAFLTGAGGAAPAVPTGPGVTLSPAIVNALVGAASDPEPIVRATAVRALAAAGPQPVVLAAMLARLVDGVRVVRVTAAEALLALGVTELPGRAGAALVRAQDELAESLQTFPDSAEQHAQRAWLEAERGRVGAAREALTVAVHLDPTYARSFVIEGVLAARENRFDRAVELWKKARSLEPSYPNIDRLIEAAEKKRP